MDQSPKVSWDGYDDKDIYAHDPQHLPILCSCRLKLQSSIQVSHIMPESLLSTILYFSGRMSHGILCARPSARKTYMLNWANKFFYLHIYSWSRCLHKFGSVQVRRNLGHVLLLIQFRGQKWRIMLRSRDIQPNRYVHFITYELSCFLKFILEWHWRINPFGKCAKCCSSKLRQWNCFRWAKFKWKLHIHWN